MTANHAVKGLTVDVRSSLRLQNPLAGLGSNGCDYQLKESSSIRTNIESVGREKNATGQGLEVTSSSCHQKSPAPKIGDNFLPSAIDIYRCDKTTGNVKGSPCFSGILTPRKNCIRIMVRSKYSNADTYLNIFGAGYLQRRKMFRKIYESDDSFSRIFGQKSFVDSLEMKKVGDKMCAVLVKNMKNEIHGLPSGDAAELPTSFCHVASAVGKVMGGNKISHLNLMCRNRYGNKIIPLSRRITPKSAYNPITGEPVELPNQKEEPKQEPKQEPKLKQVSQVPSLTSSESSTGKALTESSSGADTVHLSSASATKAGCDKPRPRRSAPPTQLKHQSGERATICH